LPSWDVTYIDKRKFVQTQGVSTQRIHEHPKYFYQKLVTDLLEDALKKALQSEGAPFQTFQPPLEYRSSKLLAYRSDAAEAHSCSGFPPLFQTCVLTIEVKSYYAFVFHTFDVHERARE
jgi:hypothetical protein